MKKVTKSTLKKGSPYKFETYLNGAGHTVVYIVKGKKKVWLFNIVDGYLGFDISASKEEYESVGLDTIENRYGNIRPVTHGLEATTKQEEDNEYIKEMYNKFSNMYNWE